MLVVSPIQSKEEQKQICELCGIEFNPDYLAYKAVDGDLIGICQFSISDKVGIIQNLKYASGADDSEAMIIMLRATMSFMNRIGLNESVFDEKDVEPSLYKLSSYTKKDDDLYHINLDLFYGSHHH